MDTVPVVILGGNTTDPDQQFSGITAAFRLPDGSIVLADQGSNQILVYSVDGTLMRSMGRRGKGPGEFTMLDAVVRLGGDSVAAWDLYGRVTVFDSGGNVARTRNELVQGRSYGWMTALADEALFYWERGEFVAEGVVRQPTFLVRASVQGSETDTVGTWPANATAWARDRGGLVFGRSVPFTTGSLSAAGGVPWRLAVGTGEEPYVELLDKSGRRISSVSWAPRGRSISRKDWDQAVADRGELLATVERPDRAPAYDALAVDSIGSIWTRHYPFPEDTEDVWTVLDSEGAWLGDVSIQRGCEIKSIGGDYVLCKFRDELNVESISMFHLRR